MAEVSSSNLDGPTIYHYFMVILIYFLDSILYHAAHVLARGVIVGVKKNRGHYKI